MASGFFANLTWFLRLKSPLLAFLHPLILLRCVLSQSVMENHRISFEALEALLTPDFLAFSADLDDNYALYRQKAGAELDAAEAKRALRKIDKGIVPTSFFIYLP